MFQYEIAKSQNKVPNVVKLSKECLYNDAWQANDSETVLQALDHLLNEWMDLEGPLVLVIDDYHYIQNIKTHDFISYCIEHLSPMVHLVIITRYTPPLPIVKWQAKGQVIVIEPKHLNFTQEETFELVSLRKTIHLNETQVIKIQEKSEGWITAICLFLIALESREVNIDEYLELVASNHEEVLSYIMDEVFHELDKETQTFLIHTSIINHVSTKACDAIFETNDSAEKLQKLEANHLFVVPLDQQDVSYRYHYLFHLLLRRELAKQPKASVIELREKAIKYYLKEGDYSSALHQAQMTRDQSMLAEILHSHVQTILKEDGPTEVVSILQVLDDKYFVEYPLLLLYKAFLWLVAKGGQNVEHMLSEAEFFYYIEEEKQLQYKGIFHSVRCLFELYRNNMEKAKNDAQKALELLPVDHSFWKMGVAIFSGDALLFTGNPKEAFLYYLQAHQSNQLVGQKHFLLSSGIKLTYTYLQMGQLCEMEKSMNEMFNIANESGFQGLGKTGALWGLLALLLHEKGDRTEVQKCLARSLRITKSTKTYYSWILLFKTKISIDEENYNEALKSVKMILNIDEENKLPLYITHETKAYEALILYKIGMVDQANEILDKIGVCLDRSPNGGEEIMYMVKLEIQIDQGLLPQKKGKEMLNHLERIMKLGDQRRNLMSLYLLKIKFAEKHGDINITMLKSEAVKYAKAHGFLRQLNRISTLHQQESIGNFEQYIEPLSKRELEILKLIDQGLTNKEICETLFLSMSTVKWHTSNIYGKLGVRGRTQALSATRKLTWI